MKLPSTPKTRSPIVTMSIMPIETMSFSPISRDSSGALCQRCGLLDIELNKAKCTIEKLQQECQALKLQLMNQPVARGSRAHEKNEMVVDEYADEIDSGLSASRMVGIESTLTWFDTNEPGTMIAALELPLADDKFDIAKCVDVIDPSEYLDMKNDTGMEEGATAAELISAISNSDCLDAADGMASYLFSTHCRCFDDFSNI